MVELYNFMKENVAGFENATLLASAPSIGTRESRMVKGKYTIVADDIVNCTKFEDSIARGNYEIDIHSPTEAARPILAYLLASIIRFRTVRL